MSYDEGSSVEESDIGISYCSAAPEASKHGLLDDESFRTVLVIERLTQRGLQYSLVKSAFSRSVFDRFVLRYYR